MISGSDLPSLPDCALHDFSVKRRGLESPEVAPSLLECLNEIFDVDPALLSHMDREGIDRAIPPVLNLANPLGLEVVTLWRQRAEDFLINRPL
jgi:hypothetical protein